MKDGTDGATYSFKLKTVELGFDAHGEAESSCVIEHVDTPAPTNGGKQRPSGRHQQLLFDVLKTMAPSGTVDLEDLLAGYATKMPRAEGRDNRRRDGRRALEELITKRLAYMHGEDRVSITSLVTTGDDAWLK